MEVRKTSLERAFELARSGKCLHVSDIDKQLRSEKFDPIYSRGKSLKTQLSKLIEEAKPSHSAK
jgi:hypothetical protein